ncbi:S41 family peptidase [uncultured Pontibacter sp.]|uniref:S41 family peptidase n=1 Tax=uncultured Pontibacter sp. TaxID=453356 RepID=UPI0026122362|nr:S41 family peptidase [uncultured Pontibacter sp.]
MKQFYPLFILSFLLTFTIPSQAQDCNCTEAFEQTVQNYESNYSLFHLKVTDKNREIYKAHTVVYRNKAAEVQQIEDCLPVLQQWLTFFWDGHSRIEYTGASGKENRSERIEMDRKKYHADYKKKKYKKNDLLGIWKYSGYEVAILPDPNNDARKSDFVGIVLSSTNKNWKPGDVKFKLTHIYGNDYSSTHFMDDYSSKKVTGNMNSPHQLEFKNFNNWTKVWPVADPTTTVKEENLYSEFHFRMIDGEVPYLRLPNFYEKKPAFVDSLLKAHHDELLQAEFIVVDVRDNNGGNDNVYYPVLPYLLTGPIQIPQAGLWMSEGNLETVMNHINPEDLNEEEKAQYDFFMSLKNSFYWYGNDEYAYTYTPKAVFAPNKKVAVLMNGKTASSGETFVYRVNQSDKVVLYGQNTAGVVDGFSQFTRSIGCFELKYPSSLRSKDIAEHPVDPYGFAPDVYLSEEVDALEFSIRHMRELIKAQKD